MTYTHPSDDDLRKIYRDSQTIAVVGASADPSKPAHSIPAFLKDRGYRVIPITPKTEPIFDEQPYSSLREFPDAIDVVDVFRPAEEAPDVARSAVEAGAKVLWLQEGIVSEEAAEIASAGGLKVVMDACMGATYRRLHPDPQER